MHGRRAGWDDLQLLEVFAQRIASGSRDQCGLSRMFRNIAPQKFFLLAERQRGRKLIELWIVCGDDLRRTMHGCPSGCHAVSQPVAAPAGLRDDLRRLLRVLFGVWRVILDKWMRRTAQSPNES